MNPLPIDDDPSTWFLGSKFIGAGGYDIPGMVRLAGQAWRRYGSPPSDRGVFDVGPGPNSGFLGTLPSPTKVWLYGAEFEIIDIEDCDDWVDVNGNPGCETCYEVVPRNADGTIPIKNSVNPFPEFATDLQNLDIYANIRLCPTGNKTEIGVIDIAVALLRARIALALDRIAFVATWSVWEGIWSFLACRLQSARPAL